MRVALLFVSLFPILASSVFTIAYYSPRNLMSVVVGKQQTFADMPDVHHTADLVARLGGHPAFLREESLNLPLVHFPEGVTKAPIILELTGGALPNEAKVMVKSSSSSVEQQQFGPSAQSVASLLANHNIDIRTHSMSRSEDVAQWLAQQDRPVIVFHHDTAAPARITRALDATSLLTEFDISNYQICLWTGVVMVLLLLSAICSIMNMEVIPDSLLFAKFQSTRAHKSD